MRGALTRFEAGRYTPIEVAKEEAMRPQDQKVFGEAAVKFQCWILVRRTNPASLPYIGRPGFAPKRIDCKAKTADNNIPGQRYQLAGLVVDAVLHSGAFKPAKQHKAREAWQQMAPLIGRVYSVEGDTNSPHYGCLKLNGAFIHGDYDLYDIIDITQPHRNLAAVETMLGQPHMRGAKLIQVQEFVNTRIGSPMVQHGGEAQYADHSQQALDAFGPAGEACIILNEFSVRGWYQDRFGGRKTLGR